MEENFIDPEIFFSEGSIEHPNYWIARPSINRVILSKNNFDEIDETFYCYKDRKMDRVYLEMAKVWATNSYCKRMKVGSLIVKNKSIISDGYNGAPSGFPNICEDDSNVTLPHILHAEANAITKLAKTTQSSDGSTIYVTVSPCFECSKLLIQSGIKKLVFKDLYRKSESLKFLFEAGVEIIRLNN
jgi:dCMP deaminase